MYVDIPEGAVRLIYTVDGTDPRQSEDTKLADEALDIAGLLKGRSNVKIRMRAIDQDGNASDAVSVELVSKERKYEIQIKPEMFGETEASFKCPEDTEGLIAVFKSIIAYGVKMHLLNSEKAKKLEMLLSELVNSK